MVFVAVGQDQGRQVVPVFFEKIEIWDRNVDTKGRFFGKAHARVDQDHLVAVTDAHAIHSEFTDPAERYYFNFIHLLIARTSLNSIHKTISISRSGETMADVFIRYASQC